MPIVCENVWHVVFLFLLERKEIRLESRATRMGPIIIFHWLFHCAHSGWIISWEIGRKIGFITISFVNEYFYDDHSYSTWLWRLQNVDGASNYRRSCFWHGFPSTHRSPRCLGSCKRAHETGIIGTRWFSSLYNLTNSLPLGNVFGKALKRCFILKFQIGNILSPYISGLILSIWPWPTVFYLWGAIAIVWFILFVSLIKKVTQQIKCHELVCRYWFATKIRLHIHISLKKNANISKQKWDNWNATKICRWLHGKAFSPVFPFWHLFALR